MKPLSNGNVLYGTSLLKCVNDEIRKGSLDQVIPIGRSSRVVGMWRKGGSGDENTRSLDMRNQYVERVDRKTRNNGILTVTL